MSHAAGGRTSHRAGDSRGTSRGRLAALLAAAVVLTTGCAPDPESEQADARPPLPPPAGAEIYGEILHRQAGVALAPADLAAAAGRDAARIEERLQVLAERVASGATWREVFTRLREDHPEDAEGALAAYRREADRARRFVAEQHLMTLPEPPDRAPFEVISTAELPIPERYPLTAYLGYRLAVATRGADGSPRLAAHCGVCVPPMAVHEVFPGHHAAFIRQRAAAAHSDAEDPAVMELAGEHFKNRFFHEGWGQYAEIAMLEAGYYAGRPEREMGAWRNLLLRVVRARIDPLLHTGELTAEGAAQALERELLLSPALARDEVRRHLEEPGLKAAYYVGAVQVLALRRALAARDGDAFDLRAFHDRFVERPLPVPMAARLRFGVDLGPAGGWPLEHRTGPPPLAALVDLPGIIEP